MWGSSLPAIEAPLTFIDSSCAKPRVILSADYAQANTRTGEFRAVQVTVADARSLSEAPTLDREGFGFERHATRVVDFYDSAAVLRVYYNEIVELLKRVTGASEVHVFDHTLRVEDEARRKAHGTRLPVSVVHNDYTERSGPQRVRDILAPEVAERLLRGRFAMVNVWRSFGASAERFPLAAADGRTVAPDDYVSTDLVYPDRTGEIYYIRHSIGQRWFWFSRMHRHETMLLKCFDSARDGRTRYTAHTGFANPHAPPDSPPRESIEVRAVLSFA